MILKTLVPNGMESGESDITPDSLTKQKSKSNKNYFSSHFVKALQLLIGILQRKWEK